MYEGATGVWRTPGGVSAVMHYRLGTNDWNTISAVFDNDEYRIPQGLSGLALDIGAHIGAVTVALALDNPDLDIIAVEPVPDNRRLWSENVSANGLARRPATTGMVPFAAAAPGVAEVAIRHGFRGSEVATHHAFIGNSALPAGAEYEVALVRGWSLGRLVPQGQRVAWMKVDIEGAEYGFLSDPAVALVDTIVGEWHPDTPTGRDGSRERIVDLLGGTHRVTFTGPEAGPGGFRAERR